MRRLFQKQSGRQTDKRFFSKRHFKQLLTTSSFLSTVQRHEKRDKKPLKQLCDGGTDGLTNGLTDRRTNGLTDQKVAYRVA